MPAGRRAHNLLAAAFYLAAAVVMTWPLVTVIDRELAWDLGDPLFNTWVLLWTGGQVLAFLSGDAAALSRFWHGNIFHPEPLTVAYSEHLVPQMLQALPVLAATDNAVLAYNLLFLSTFVLAGLGTFLLVRELTGSTAAGLVAGLAFAFAPYRISQYSHLQVLSSQWMPFVLYGYRRYFVTGRRTPLAWGTVALVLQNLSCGYYLLFFTPFVALYVLYEMTVRGRLHDLAEWRRWIVAGGLALLATLPFLTPYLEVRKSGDLGVRTLEEVVLFSADTRAFVTPAPSSRLWAGRLPGLDRAEGEGFPGLTIAALAALGALAALAAGLRRARHDAGPPLPFWRQALAGALGFLLAAHALGAISVLVVGGMPIPLDGTWVMVRRSDGVLIRLVLLAAAWLAVSPGARRMVRGALESPASYFAGAAVLAALLALGPQIAVDGRVVGAGPYGWLMAHVPGFDGVRVPARFLMLVALFLACLAGFGAAAVCRVRPRAAAAVVVTAGLLILTESWVVPFATNVRMAADGYETTPRDLWPGRDLPALYKVIRDLPEPVVLVEFPFGSHAWDLQTMFYAGHHRRPIVNGYSGFFPLSQRTLVGTFGEIGSSPDAAWRALLETGATHVLVHEAAYIPSQQGLVSAWLRARGATDLLADGTNRLYRLR